jgi:hypothetical protein
MDFSPSRENRSKSKQKFKKPVALELRTGKKKQILIQGLKEIACKGWKDALKIFYEGELRRRYAVTNMNHNSSRSHVVFQIKVDLTMFKTHFAKKNPKILLLDLAGSESIKRTKMEDKQQLKESSNINKSLLALTRVISKLNKVN